MNVAFYCPLKPPDHPTPSGDRLVARLAAQALGLAGADVQLVSRLRAFSKAPDRQFLDGRLMQGRQAAQELIARWSSREAGWRPDIWLTYHPYYKAPDLIGPTVCRVLSIPYFTLEASFSPRRTTGPWAQWQRHVAEAVELAKLNFCLTDRDREGLGSLGRHVRTAAIKPFIDVARFRDLGAARPNAETVKFVTVAMMRAGDKLASYEMLARVLKQVADRAWTLDVVGDGPEREAVEAAFIGLEEGRVHFRGELDADGVVGVLAQGDAYLWPGYGEAFGLAFLEAQAAGLPVVAQDTGGIRAVVRDGETGWLTAVNDDRAYQVAIARLIDDGDMRRCMGAAARTFVMNERTVEIAAGAFVGHLRDAGIHWRTGTLGHSNDG